MYNTDGRTPFLYVLSVAADRLKTISYMKIIGIILVVAGHSLAEYPSDDGLLMDVYWALYTFRMPLFVFASGVVLALSYCRRGESGTLRSVPSFVADKALRLLVPYFAVMGLVAVPRVLLNGMADDELSLGIGSFTGTSPLVIAIYWFLPFSFVLMCAGYAGLRLSERVSPWLFLGVVIPLMAWLMLTNTGCDIALFSYGNVHRLGIYFFLGMACGLYYERVTDSIPWSSPWLFAASAATWLTLVYINNSQLTVLLCGLAGIAMIVSLVHIMVERGWNYLDPLEGATYMIFLLSWFANVGSQQVLSHIVELPWWVYSLLSLAGGIIVPVWVYRTLMSSAPNHAWARVSLFLLGHSAPARSAASSVRA